MKGTKDLGTTGYKVGAYINMVFAAPFSFVYLFWLVIDTKLVASWLDTTMRFSVAGPWFFNFYAIGVIFFTGLNETTWLQFVGVALYLTYSFFACLMQLWWVPGVARYYTLSKVTGKNFYNVYVTPEADEEGAPDMEDLTYQEVI